MLEGTYAVDLLEFVNLLEFGNYIPRALIFCSFISMHNTMYPVPTHILVTPLSVGVGVESKGAEESICS